MTRTVNPDLAEREAIVEWVYRQCVECLNCGGPLFWQTASRKWRHVRGDRMGPTRCRPGSNLEAAPAVDPDGQAVLPYSGGAA